MAEIKNIAVIAKRRKMSFSLQGTFHSLNKEEDIYIGGIFIKKKEKRPHTIHILLGDFFFPFLLYIKH